MQSITILAVGSLKDRWLREGCAEYAKRLEAYCKLQLVEIPESRLPDSPSPKEIEKALAAEAAAMAAKWPKGAYLAGLCIEGERFDSPALAQWLGQTAVEGHSHLAFCIGGSHGLSEELKKNCRLRLSFSPMTFPHQLTRVLLLEQLYRAESILAGAKYHK